MKKIGMLFGMENTFPPAVVEKINGMKADGITAEFVKVGGVKMAEPSGSQRTVSGEERERTPAILPYILRSARTGAWQAAPKDQGWCTM